MLVRMLVPAVWRAHVWHRDEYRTHSYSQFGNHCHFASRSSISAARRRLTDALAVVQLQHQAAQGAPGGAHELPRTVTSSPMKRALALLLLLVGSDLAAGEVHVPMHDGVVLRSEESSPGWLLRRPGAAWCNRARVAAAEHEPGLGAHREM